MVSLVASSPWFFDSLIGEMMVGGDKGRGDFGALWCTKVVHQHFSV